MCGGRDNLWCVTMKLLMAFFRDNAYEPERCLAGVPELVIGIGRHEGIGTLGNRMIFSFDHQNAGSFHHKVDVRPWVGMFGRIAVRFQFNDPHDVIGPSLVLTDKDLHPGAFDFRAVDDIGHNLFFMRYDHIFLVFLSGFIHQSLKRRDFTFNIRYPPNGQPIDIHWQTNQYYKADSQLSKECNRRSGTGRARPAVSFHDFDSGSGCYPFKCGG
jgi:hypothetical protein